MSQTNVSRRHSQNVNTDRVEYHYMEDPSATDVANAVTGYTFIPAPEAITLISTQPKIIKVTGYHYRLLGTVEPAGQTWDSGNTFAALYSNNAYIPVYETTTASSPNYLKIGTATKGYKYYQKVNEESYYELIGKMPNELESGEIGVGRSANNEVMYIKNSDGQMIEFRSYKANVNYVNNEVTDIYTEITNIYNALNSMEKWPTVETVQNSISPTTLAVSTSGVPNSINTYYKIAGTTTASSNVVLAESAVVLATDISVSTAASFTPSSNETYTAENIISGMDYGYKNALSDSTKQTATTKTANTSVAPTFTRNNQSNTSSTTLKLYKNFNGGTYTEALSVNNSGGTANIKLTSGTSLGTLAEGTTRFRLEYTNPSTISRTAKSYSIAAVNAFYSSNINNFDSNHEATVATYSGSLPAVGATYATDSTDGVKKGSTYTVYAVYYIKTNGSATSSTPITGAARTAGTSGSAINNFGSLVNYAKDSTSTYYVSFGLIKITDTSVTKSYVYTPNNVTLTSCQGANSSTGSYDSGTVNMQIELVGTETIDGVSYKKYWIKNPTGSTSEGANSYKLTISA